MEDIADELGGKSRRNLADACYDKDDRCAFNRPFPDGEARSRNRCGSEAPGDGPGLRLEGCEESHRTVGWSHEISRRLSCGDVVLDRYFGRRLVMADCDQRRHKACDREQAGDLEG